MIFIEVRMGLILFFLQIQTSQIQESEVGIQRQKETTL
jgi:hypothetical protein